jgi:membrane dipeptidase
VPLDAYINHRADPAGWANELGISREAVELYLDSDVIDLHVDSFIWQRILGYDLRRRHGRGVFGGWFYSQVDLPRLREASITGATWVITTNPLKDERARAETLEQNLRELTELFASVSEECAIVRNVREYRAAQKLGKHAAFIGIQGGNALPTQTDARARLLDDRILRVTLVHLTSSGLGTTSAPSLGADAGLSREGAELVEDLDDRKILPDLAHLSRKTFWDVSRIRDPSRPLLVSHTGIDAVYPCWRNLDDAQLRRVAETGGTVGIMYHTYFLAPRFATARAEAIVRHIDHVIETVGEDHVSLGSDWDGAITPPRDMRTCLELPRLVELMLHKKYSAERIQKVLGRNFLRVLELVRG